MPWETWKPLCPERHGNLCAMGDMETLVPWATWTPLDGRTSCDALLRMAVHLVICITENGSTSCDALLRMVVHLVICITKDGSTSCDALLRMVAHLVKYY